MYVRKGLVADVPLAAALERCSIWKVANDLGQKQRATKVKETRRTQQVGRHQAIRRLLVSRLRLQTVFGQLVYHMLLLMSVQL